MSAEVFILLVLGLTGWYWYAGMQAREQAIAAGRRACQEGGVQFLDETVSQIRHRFARDGDGVLGLTRHYRFEFSSTGADRSEGRIEVRNGRVEWVRLGNEWRVGVGADSADSVS